MRAGHRGHGMRTGIGDEMKTICVFCGSREGRVPAYLESARALGTAIAASGITLVYGGGGQGMMGAVADGALAARAASSA